KRLPEKVRPIVVVMASMTTCAIGILGTLIVALLIVCVGLLSAILHNQKHPSETTQSQPQPQLAKNLVVLVDASTGVDNTLLGREADFLNQQLRESLLAQSSGYTMRLAAAAFASQVSSQLNYVDLNDASAVKALADAIRNGKRDEPLDLGKALSSLQSTLRAGRLGQQTLIVFASGQGENYENAVTEANSLKGDGTHIVAISLNSNGADLSQFASSGSSLDGQAIKSASVEGMQNLANGVGDIVAAQPPVVLTTTTSPVQPQSTRTTTTTTSQPPTTITTQPTTATTATTEVDRKILVLVDASSGITQEQMIKQTAFVSTELMSSFLYPSEHGYKTGVLLVPYAFDTSPDNSEYILPDNLLSIDKQATSTKLARITTFVTPLDRLQIGQAFAEVERYDAKLTPTHIVVLASGQGGDYETAVTIAKRFTNANIKVISVATVGSASDLSGITSDGVCALDGRDILEGKDLVSMADNIAKCIYPQSALPTKQKAKVITQKVVPQKPKAKLAYVPPTSSVKEIEVPVTEAEQPTSIDVVILVDTSENATSDESIKNQTTFIKSYLLESLRSTFNGEQLRVVVIPYAFFLGAVAEEFVVINTPDNSLLDVQLRRARVAPITSFMPPLNEYQLAPTLQLLAESYFVESTRTKILLLADDQNPTEQVENAEEYVKNLTSTNKAIVVVSLTGNQKEYEAVFGEKNVFSGSAIKSQTETDWEKLAQNVTEAFKSYTPPSFTTTTSPSILARTQLSGS
uniref:VWFA domain-containing protein n=1 Tax=Parascaris univalens TaxID=6257 RepID=A0A915BW41_PARUN